MNFNQQGQPNQQQGGFATQQPVGQPNQGTPFAQQFQQPPNGATPAQFYGNQQGVVPANVAPPQQQYQFPMTQGNVPTTGLSQGEWDIVFTDSGEMTLAPRGGQNPAQQQVQGQVQQSPILNNLGPQQQQQQLPQPFQPASNPSDQKIAALEKNIHDLTQIIVGLTQQGQLGQPPAFGQPNNFNQNGFLNGYGQQQDPAYGGGQQLDLNNPAALMQMVNQSVSQVVQKALQPHSQAMEDMKVRMEFSQAAAMYGPDFQAKLPMMKAMMDSDPNASRLSFSSLYQMIKMAEGPGGMNGNGAYRDSTVQHQMPYGQQPQPQPMWQMNPQQLQQRANMLQTEAQNGYQNYNQMVPRQANTVADAVNMALNEVLANR